MVQNHQAAGKGQHKALRQPLIGVSRNKKANNVDKEKQHKHTKERKLLYQFLTVFHFIPDKGMQQQKNRTDQQKRTKNLYQFGF